MIDGQHRIRAFKEGEADRFAGVLLYMPNTGAGKTFDAVDTWRMLLRYKAARSTGPRQLLCPSCGSADMARELYSEDVGDPLTCQACGAITRLRIKGHGAGLLLHMDVVE